MTAREPDPSVSFETAFDLDIVALGGQGDAIARREGEVVLVPDGCPGDRARIEVYGRRRGVARGRLRQLLTPSPDRVEPRCAVASRCGGCTWQHVTLERQRAEKLGLLQRALGRPAPTASWAADVPTWAQRRRVRLHLRRQGGQVVVGMMARGSDEVVATESCPVLDPVLEQVRVRAGGVLWPWVQQGELYLVAGVEGVIASLHGRPAEALPSAAQAAAALGVAGLTLRLGAHADSTGLTEVTLPETAGPCAVTVDAEGFCQASAAANAAIRAAVAEVLASIGRVASAHEFFAGSGNFSALLQPWAGRVRTTELDGRAVARARRSLAGTGIRAEVGDAADAAAPAELWLLDPGRTGARELVERAEALAPRYVVYVSCALDTLARDLGTLRAAGYVVQQALAIDAFAHTPHLEAVVQLARA